MSDMPDPLRSDVVRLRDGRTVTVRPAVEDDAAALLDNVNAVCAEEVYLLLDEVPRDLEAERRWIATFDRMRDALLVAVHGDAIVGQADCHGGRFSKNRHTGLIGIAIRDGWREAGLGRTLLERILDWMRERGFEKACLEVFSTNARARRLYESLGFTVEGTRKGQFRIRGASVDDVVMARWLK